MYVYTYTIRLNVITCHLFLYFTSLSLLPLYLFLHLSILSIHPPLHLPSPTCTSLLSLLPLPLSLLLFLSLLLPLSPFLFSFFQELNSQLLRTVWDAASSEDHVLTVEMVDSIGLHPVKDKLFLTELAKAYDLDFTVQRPTDMFSCCL